MPMSLAQNETETHTSATDEVNLDKRPVKSTRSRRESSKKSRSRPTTTTCSTLKSDEVTTTAITAATTGSSHSKCKGSSKHHRKSSSSSSRNGKSHSSSSRKSCSTEKHKSEKSEKKTDLKSKEKNEKKEKKVSSRKGRSVSRGRSTEKKTSSSSSSVSKRTKHSTQRPSRNLSAAPMAGSAPASTRSVLRAKAEKAEATELYAEEEDDNFEFDCSDLSEDSTDALHSSDDLLGPSDEDAEEEDEDDSDYRYRGASEQVDTDFVGDFAFVEQSHEKDFTCLTEKDIVQEQQKAIRHVADVLALTDTQAGALLRHFKWKKEVVFLQYFENRKKTLEAAGVKASEMRPKEILLRARSSALLVANDNECSICGEDEEKNFALRCGHGFCRDCWEQYLSLKIKEGEAGEIQCPDFNCNLLVDEHAVKQLVSVEIYERYQSFLLRSFVEANDAVKWCPAPKCGRAVNIDGASAQMISCACGHRFCFKCGEEAHLPASCQQVREWKKKSRDESETNHWITANTQPCPKCGSPTEKNGGCNHMICRGCTHEYCWMCLRDWKGHNDFYTCNRYEKSKAQAGKKRRRGKRSKMDAKLAREQAQQEQKARLERYLHFYNRHMNHDMSGHYERVREDAQRRMQEWTETDGTSAQVRFIEKATETLLECRSALKWSYVVAYYMPTDDPQVNLFQYVQSHLEKTVERLSEVLETPKSRKLEVVDLARVADTRLHNLCSWVDYSSQLEIPDEPPLTLDSAVL